MTNKKYTQFIWLQRELFIGEIVVMLGQVLKEIQSLFLPLTHTHFLRVTDILSGWYKECTKPHLGEVHSLTFQTDCRCKSLLYANLGSVTGSRKGNKLKGDLGLALKTRSKYNIWTLKRESSIDSTILKMILAIKAKDFKWNPL